MGKPSTWSLFLELELESVDPWFWDLELELVTPIPKFLELELELVETCWNWNWSFLSLNTTRKYTFNDRRIMTDNNL